MVALPTGDWHHPTSKKMVHDRRVGLGFFPVLGLMHLAPQELSHPTVVSHHGLINGIQLPSKWPMLLGKRLLSHLFPQPGAVICSHVCPPKFARISLGRTVFVYWPLTRTCLLQQELLLEQLEALATLPYLMPPSRNLGEFTGHLFFGIQGSQKQHRIGSLDVIFSVILAIRFPSLPIGFAATAIDRAPPTMLVPRPFAAP